ncbi:MAG TPA: efflux RND transporter permease subunit [Verrucomicrobiae bacterium]
MLRRLVELSLRKRGVIITLAVGLIVYGLFVTARAKLDVFPDFVQPQVTVQTESPGLSPEQVEQLVTRPVETVLDGAVDLETIRSESIEGLSVVTAIFKDGTDIFKARQMLQERLAQLTGSLPLGVAAPKMEPLTSSTMDLLKFGLTSDKLSPMDLRTFADWTVRPKLLSVSGVAAVKVFGGAVRELQIQFQPERLQMFGLTVQDVSSAARAATGVRGAGYVETAAQRLPIQTEGQTLTAAQLGEVVMAQRGDRVIRLKDVATVVDGAQPKFGGAIINGKPGILMTTASQYGANTMDVTRGVEAALDELRPAFAAQGIDYVPRLHRPATFIEHAIHNMKMSLLLGAALVAVVLFLFLLDLRTALISFLSIPLSLLAAVIVLDHFGVTLNTMTLGGLAVAIGVVVDDAIIDVENILRRLRENQVASAPRPLFNVVLEASLEVRSAVVYATFIVALVFLPVLLLTGLQGKFFAPLGITFILAIMASLVVALTATPALCFALLSRIKPHAEPNYLRRLKNFHRWWLEKISRWPKTVIAAGAIVFAGSLATLPFFGGEFLPDFREGHFVVQLTMAPGTSLPEMLRLGTQISQDLLKIEAVQGVEEQAGRAEGGEDTWGPHRGVMHVELKPTSGEDQEKVQDQIRDVLSKYPGVQSEVLTFLGDRIGETIAGETAQVVVNVFGDDLNAIDAKAAEVAEVLKKVPGAADVQVAAPPGAPRVAVRLRPERLAQFGYRPTDVLEAVQTAYEGDVAAQIYAGEKVFNVTVILDEATRTEPEKIGELLVANSQGLQMPLRELATVELTTGRYSILHDGARRRQTITCNPAGRDVASFVADAQKQIAAKVKFPANIYLEYSGAAEQQAQAQRELILRSLVAAGGILLLLAMVFRKARHVVLVLTNVPFALVGGVLAIFAAGMLGGEHQASLSLGTLVGFVTLFGITMRNSIMMISHFEHLVREEGLTWGLECAMRGATERLVPILMTAIVTGLGLLPLALGGNEAGREIEGPMAIVILGGLVTSTALNLLVLPTLALRFGKFGRD